MAFEATAHQTPLSFLRTPRPRAAGRSAGLTLQGQLALSHAVTPNDNTREPTVPMLPKPHCAAKLLRPGIDARSEPTRLDGPQRSVHEAVDRQTTKLSAYGQRRAPLLGSSEQQTIQPRAKPCRACSQAPTAVTPTPMHPRPQPQRLTGLTHNVELTGRRRARRDGYTPATAGVRSG